MYDMFDYLEWRGDISFAQVDPNPVDLLILSTLSYILFDNIVPGTPDQWISLREAGEQFLAQEVLENKVRVKKDLELLRAAMENERFGDVHMSFYRNILDPEQELQFSAVTYTLGNGVSVVAFRGTDRTLVGWKEDFNMAFQESVPAQREALKYLEELAIYTLNPLILVGHSKGGNLAVYAAAKVDKETQERILEIHNQDGPGFSKTMMSDSGYLAIVPKISTYVPESSMVGILLEHEEPHMVIKSKQIGPMQHDPYSWEITRNDFVYVKEMSEGAKFLDRTTKAWMESMTIEDRNMLVDVVYEILTSGGAIHVDDLLQPKQIGNSVKSLAADEKRRKWIGKQFVHLVRLVAELETGITW